MTQHPLKCCKMTKMSHYSKLIKEKIEIKQIPPQTAATPKKSDFSGVATEKEESGLRFLCQS